MSFYHFLTKISWNGIQDLVLYSGTQATGHIRLVLSWDALAEISLDWISDLRLRSFPLEIECDYDKTLAGLLKGDHMTGDFR